MKPLEQVPGVPLEVRNDPAGQGHYGASRGSRKHRGIDYVCDVELGWPVLSPCDGKVTKVGYPYADDLSWRYVQVTDAGGRDHRVFYIDPLVAVGDRVQRGDDLGTPQDITQRYPGQGMTPHVHYEIKQGSEYLDPEEVLRL